MEMKGCYRRLGQSFAEKLQRIQETVNYYEALCKDEKRLFLANGNTSPTAVFARTRCECLGGPPLKALSWPAKKIRTGKSAIR